MSSSIKQPQIILTAGQQKVLGKMINFVLNSSDRVFILKGYAGTGKTTLMSFLIKEMKKHNQAYRLLSTTGRAAKILSNHTGVVASTIHSTIYKYRDFNQDVSNFNSQITTPDKIGQLVLVFEPAKLENNGRQSCVYIIDEASMVSDKEPQDVLQAKFGEGRLLKELLDYDTMSQSKYIFVGDPCQLPPIEGSFSPALSQEYFSKQFGLSAQEAELTQIMRQDNSIIKAGEYVRGLWKKAPETSESYSGKVWGRPLLMSRFSDFVIHPNYEEMERLYFENIRKNGYEDSIFICNSNKKSRELSLDIRSKLGFSGIVQKGDLLMVIQNQMTTGLMNGDMVKVVSVSKDSERVMRDVKNSDGYHTNLLFREITVKELFSGREVTTLLLENTLQTTQNNLDSRQQTGLFLDFILRMQRKGIKKKKLPGLFEEKMYNDPYLNALRCSYGYAITCHKAQGGEWNSIFVQTPRDITLNPVKGKYQWFYTAITRARKTVHLCKDFFIE